MSVTKVVKQPRRVRGFAAYRGNARNEAGESWQLVLMAPDKVKSFGECRKLCSRYT